jgi:hypothetical protein
VRRCAVDAAMQNVEPADTPGELTQGDGQKRWAAEDVGRLGSSRLHSHHVPFIPISYQDIDSDSIARASLLSHERRNRFWSCPSATSPCEGSTWPTLATFVAVLGTGIEVIRAGLGEWLATAVDCNRPGTGLLAPRH